jgi:hypothetical protein
VKTNNVTHYQNQPLSLAATAETKLEALTDAFSVAMNLVGLDRFDFTPGCACPVCVLEGKISSIYGILEQATTTEQQESRVA